MARPQLCPCFWSRTWRTVGAQSLWGAGMMLASSMVYTSVMMDFRERPGRYKVSWPRWSGRVLKGGMASGQAEEGQPAAALRRVGIYIENLYNP